MTRYKKVCLQIDAYLLNISIKIRLCVHNIAHVHINQPFIYMQEQLFIADQQSPCSPPSKPYLKPQTQPFLEDQFSLDSPSHSQQTQKRSIEDLNQCFMLSQLETNEYTEESSEKSPNLFKRCLSEVHGEALQHSRHRLLSKLQRLDRLPVKKLHL